MSEWQQLADGTYYKQQVYVPKCYPPGVVPIEIPDAPDRESRIVLGKFDNCSDTFETSSQSSRTGSISSAMMVPRLTGLALMADNAIPSPRLPSDRCGLLSDRKYPYNLEDAPILNKYCESLLDLNDPRDVSWLLMLTTPKQGKNRPTFGIQITDAMDLETGEMSVEVINVDTSGPAFAVGIRVNDVLKQWDAVPIQSSSHFGDLVSQYDIGKTIRLLVQRGDKDVKMKLKITSNQYDCQDIVQRFHSPRGYKSPPPNLPPRT
eukprot:NODE_3592_length_939_cov_27.843596_g3440_i0.p1 GENE.NODE_3592_length_939_cov_27.843596_g3440_i0~~NODE_3592_length_939_cov_27.843596_g3440_i0.p1  ORF type:complete len:263 (+),score=39.45 NODE_3592_length_939_cov_27.843596_g3440_i0:69-857(+)